MKNKNLILIGILFSIMLLALPTVHANTASISKENYKTESKDPCLICPSPGGINLRCTWLRLKYNFAITLSQKTSALKEAKSIGCPWSILIQEPPVSVDTGISQFLRNHKVN